MEFSIDLVPCYSSWFSIVVSQTFVVGQLKMISLISADIGVLNSILNYNSSSYILNCWLWITFIISRLGLDQDFFEPHLSSPVAQMVLLSYPPPPSPADDTVCRTKHTGCGERK